jgi:hypothetical protein
MPSSKKGRNFQKSEIAPQKYIGILSTWGAALSHIYRAWNFLSMQPTIPCQFAYRFLFHIRFLCKYKTTDFS